MHNRSHIALFLGWLFLIITVFSAVHTTLHNSKKAELFTAQKEVQKTGNNFTLASYTQKHHLSCKLCKFHFSSFQFTSFTSFQFNFLLKIKFITQFQNSVKLISKPHFSLRGPPSSIFC